MKDKLMINDPPSCPFLKKSISDERHAIEDYMKESSRADDMVIKRIFHGIAVDEMNHLELLESISKNLGCPD